MDEFTKALEQSDFEIQSKYDHIHTELCNADDDILELVSKIEELKVEKEIAKRLGNYIQYIKLKIHIIFKQNLLYRIEKRYDTLLDMQEEEINKILV